MICGFQGEAGAFSEEAALLLLGDAQTRGYRTFDDLLDALSCGHIARAVLPVENSITGSIAAAHLALGKHQELSVVDELRHRIEQCLIGLPGASIAELTSAASHPAALLQCTQFFAAHPQVEPVEFYDTAGAAADVLREGAIRRAAIASARAAVVYGGAVLARAIQNAGDNYTRFALLSARS